MADYTKIVDFAAKDALASGNPSKAAQGTEVDTEYNNIATAILTKFDVNDRNVANGIAPLDASTLLPAANLPIATEVAIGALEIATAAEAAALTVDDKIITPLKFNDAADAWGAENGGFVQDLHDAAAYGVDSILFFDFSSSVVRDLTPDSSIDITAQTISVAEAGVDHDALLNFVADEHIAHTGVDITAGVGLTGGGNIAATRTIDLDISTLTNIDISQTAATDSILVNDGGTMVQMDVRDSGLRVVASAVAQTFDASDANRMNVLTGATNRAWTIPTNASVAFPIGAIIYMGARDTAEIAVTVGASVTLTSVLGSGTSRSDTIRAGGIAAAVKVSTNLWMLTGDII